MYNNDYICADAKNLPLRDRSFDTVVSIETLEHIKDQKAFINNLKSLLKKEED